MRDDEFAETAGPELTADANATLAGMRTVLARRCRAMLRGQPGVIHVCPGLHVQVGW